MELHVILLTVHLYQYNALLDLATRDQSNIYTGSWAGPATLTPDLWNQTSASEVLISGIPLLFTQTVPNPEPSPSPQPVSNSSTSTPAGPIAGGVVGGMVVIIATIVLLWYRRRRQQLLNVPSPTPFGLDQDSRTTSQRDAVSPTTRSHTKGHDGQTENTLDQGTQARGDGAEVPVEDMVRALFERIQSEPPPSYRASGPV
ncbi:hypothetical protein VNI00_009207 [Paramarasmius palmivorus]|uniref:Uncharacterized protein n=1 Tax=Paramarasmius palmivorus TaxID=297713 RepID=A0AAW0CRR9_9AGAR